MSHDSIELERLRLALERAHPHTRAGRLEATKGTPRFVFARTREGSLWRFRADLPEEQVRDLARLAGREGPPAEIGAGAPAPQRLEAMRRVLEAAPPTLEVLGETAAWAEVYRFADGDASAGD